MSPSRATRRGLIGGAFALTVSGRALAAGVADPQADDMALGSAKAKVTVIEYASVGCPHCAKWANEVFPAFKTKYVDTGKVRYVLRELITGEPRLATAGFLLARCAGPAKYFQVVEAVFARQDAIFNGSVTPAAALGAIATSVGISDDAFKACLSDQAGLDALNARNARHGNQDGVASTPIFFVNGKRIEGEQSLAQLDAAIAAAMPRPVRRRRRR